VKVNIASILEIRGGTIQFQGLQELEISDPRSGLELFKPIQVNGSITNTGKGFLVQAELDFEYQVSCGRCLESFIRSQKVSVQEQFVSGNTGHENGPDAEDEQVYRFKGDVIDLDGCLKEQILLAFPMSFVCRPDCKGFCAICGQNLNQQSCNCKFNDCSPQFEKLKDLLIIEGGGSDGQPKK
jgi:uncharacterized protein